MEKNKKKTAVCPDCGLEKEIGPVTGICKSCAARRTNAKYNGRPYVKIIDARKIPVRRGPKLKSTKEILDKEINELNLEKPLKEDNSKNEMIYSNDIKRRVDEDIEYNLRMKNISLKGRIDFEAPFKILKEVFNKIDVINEYLKAEDVFNKLENDYRHGYEHAKTNEEFSFWSQVYKYFLDERREIKNMISEYESGGYLFDKLSKDKSFMESFNEAFMRYTAIHRMNEDGTYRQVSDSKILKESDFCIGKKTETSYTGLNKYFVSIKPINKNQDPFTRCVYAKSEKDAIDDVLEFIRKIQYSIRFRNPEDITVRKISFDSEQEFL